MLFTIAAVAVVSATLLGSTYTQSQIAGPSLDVSKMDVDALQMIHDMGGLQLVMPEAFAETNCGILEASGRTIHDFRLTGVSVVVLVARDDVEHHAAELLFYCAHG